MEAVVFMFCLTLHNTEEALWFTDWQTKNLPKSQTTPNKKHFIFSVIGITALGYLAAGLFLLYPDVKVPEYAFIGFVGAMVINAAIPHLFFTAIYRKYCPGVFTGCVLIIPFHIIILCNALANGMAVAEMLISAFVVGLVLLGSIFALKRVAKIIFNETGSEERIESL